MPSWKKIITSGSDAALSTLTVSNGITGSLYGTASWALNSNTASYALNGGVTQIIAGTNVSISPTNGLGAVTINATGTSAATGSNTTGSFTNSSTWNFNHGLNNKYVIVQTYDNSFNQIIPQNINLTDDNNVTITFPTNESGYAIASLAGSTVSASYALTASYALNGGGGGIQVNDLFSYQFLLMGA